MNVFRSFRLLPRYASVVVGGVLFLACGRSGPGRSAEPSTTHSARCMAIVHGGDKRLDEAQIAANTLETITERFDSVLYAELLDLNCDGQLDYVGQVVASEPGDTEGRLVLVAFDRQKNGQWRQTLAARSEVDGRESVVVAVDLNSDNRLDLVTWGSDEGGYVPRVFRSTTNGYRRVHVPEVYHLRFEESWSQECRAHTSPALVGIDRLRFTRETIAPSEFDGHGADCSLPADTLVLRADSLVRLTQW